MPSVTFTFLKCKTNTSEVNYVAGDFNNPTQTSSATSTFAHEQGQCPGFLCSPPTNALIWLWTDLPVCFFRLVLDAANTACGWMLAFKNRTHCLRMDMGS
ncbi:hypothetical protein CMV_022865 [Castanea mollissima]|uniref:Uncharacterized protein n=1 Tax=Castanea mollissima TaxID=60419 RepID=A0A8J4QIQ6_9ROSI|nr:hypothetical protein CMV_022865 [Castanea mollissima]